MNITAGLVVLMWKGCDVIGHCAGMGYGKVCVWLCRLVIRIIDRDILTLFECKSSIHYTMPPKQPSAASMADPSAKEPLFGFLPRKVKAKQVQKALVSFLFQFRIQDRSEPFFLYKEHNINPFTKLPHTQQYRNILETRKKLPVFGQMEEFYKMVCCDTRLDLGGV